MQSIKMRSSKRQLVVVFLSSLFIIGAIFHFGASPDQRLPSKNEIISSNDKNRTEVQRQDLQLIVLTMANKVTNSARRFIRSARVNGMEPKLLGLGQPFRGLANKVCLMAQEIEAYKDDRRKVVLFADAFDVLINARADQFLDKFLQTGANILFSTERNCHPRELTSKYPPIETVSPGGGQAYLNSGLFIGYAPEVYRLVTHTKCDPWGPSDQAHYMKLFVDQSVRLSLNFKLDHRANIFHNLFLAMDDIEVRYKGREAVLHSKSFDTYPLAVHSNGPIKPFINSMSNYVAQSWNPVDGCTACLEDTIDLTKLNTENYPTVVIGVFIGKKTSSLDRFLTHLAALSYPKNRIHLFVYNNVPDHIQMVANFTSKYSTDYTSITQEGKVDGGRARDLAVAKCVEIKCHYYLNVESSAQLTNEQTLRLLVEQNRSVVAPMLKHAHADRWNFDGSLPSSWDGLFGFYPVWMDVNINKRRGLWLVPNIDTCYLVRGDVIHDKQTTPRYGSGAVFSADMRNKQVDTYVSNRVDFGHIE